MVGLNIEQKGITDEIILIFYHPDYWMYTKSYIEKYIFNILLEVEYDL